MGFLLFPDDGLVFIIMRSFFITFLKNEFVFFSKSNLILYSCHFMQNCIKNRNQLQKKMRKQNSKSNINGKIIMMQNDLMSKLATIEHPAKQSTDDLGFPTNTIQFDSLTNLLSKAKSVTAQNKDKIQVAKKGSIKAVEKKQVKQKKQQNGGTFLTGIGLAVEPQQKPLTQPNEEQETKMIHRDFYSNPMSFQQQDPDQMIKEMIKRNNNDDLAQLRRMIKQTDSSLQDYGKQLLRTRKSVLGMADKFSDIDYNVVDKIYRYEDKGY